MHFYRTLSTLTALVCSAAFASSVRAQSAPTYATDLTNVALAENGGRIVAHSTTLNDSAEFSPNHLIDGQIYDDARQTGSKGWVSNRFDPVNLDYVTIGFQDNATKRIGRIAINPAVAGAIGRWARDVQVLVSETTAEGPFRVVAELRLKQEASRQEFAILPVNAKFIRFNVRTNWGSDRAVGLGEIELYEAISNSDPLGSLISRYQGTLEELQRYRRTQIQAENGTTSQSAPPASPVAPAVLSEETRGLLQLAQLNSDANRDALPVSRTNIALKANGGRIAAYSSLFRNDPAYTPENLLDGQVFDAANNTGSFGYASEGFAPNRQYVTIGFAGDRTRLIGKLALNPTAKALSDRWARRINVEATSGDPRNGPWRTVTTINLRVTSARQEFALRPFEAKFLRFVFAANGPGDVTLPGNDPDINSDRAVALGEIEVYEATASGDALDSLIARFQQILVDLKTLRRQEVARQDTTTPANG